MPSNSPSRPERKPPIPHSSYKPSPAKRTRAAFTQLCAVLSKEWDSIRSLNLGVKSGTGVIEDVLITQLQQLANTVHVLAVADAEASRVLVQQARKLSTQQFQHLQVLLDMLGLDELSDFLKLMCSSSSTASSKRELQGSSSTHAGAMRPSTSATARSAAAASGTAASTVGAVSFKSAGSAHDLEHHDAASSSRVHARSASSQRRQRAAAGVFELSHAAYPDAPATLQHTMHDEQQQLHSGNAHCHGSHHGSPDASPQRGLRFAHLLPPGHILVKTAQALQQQQEFQAALAAATPRPTRQQQARVPPLELQQQDQQSHLPPDQLGEALGHLQGYRMGPVSVEGAWQQQQQHGSQYGTGAAVNSAWFDSVNMQQSASGHQQMQMHQSAQGPWRGSLMAEEAQACSSSSSHVAAAGIPGCQMLHQQQQQQQQQHTGAFFLSSYGGQQAQPYSTSLGQLRYKQQQLLQQQRQNFRAPPVSLQQLWKAGRAATTAAVLDAAHLPVHDSPGDALSLILAPGLVEQRQVQQPVVAQPSSSESAGTGADGCMTRTGTKSRLVSSRGSTANNSNSRPNSARNRPGSAVPALQLHKLEAGGEAPQHVDRGRGSSSSNGSSRPGSAATSSRPSSAVPTSRLGPAHSAAGSVTNRSSMQQG